MNRRTREAPVFDDRSPIYLQIADGIEDDVLSGALKEDEQVMSTNQYAAFYRINPATAAKGFAQLVDEGVLYKKRGIGMFVSPDARAKLRAQRRERFFAEVVDPMLAEARMIGGPAAEIVGHLRHAGAPGAATSPSGGSPSATATRWRSTTSTWTCRRTRFTGCSGATAPGRPACSTHSRRTGNRRPGRSASAASTRSRTRI